MQSSIAKVIGRESDAYQKDAADDIGGNLFDNQKDESELVILVHSSLIPYRDSSSQSSIQTER